jgi:cell division protein ZapA
MEAAGVSVQILDREYRIACAQGERPALLQAARMLDARMRAAREAAQGGATDTLAVTAALNLARELLHSREAELDSAAHVLRALSVRVEAALAGDLAERASHPSAG